MLELPWSINEGQVEALAAPQSTPHPTLLDGKPEAALHAPTTNCGVEPPSKTGCAGRWSPLCPPPVHLHGPCKGVARGFSVRSLPGVCLLRTVPACLPRTLMPRCRARDDRLLHCHWVYMGCGGEMRPEVTDKYNCKQVIHAC